MPHSNFSQDLGHRVTMLKYVLVFAVVDALNVKEALPVPPDQASMGEMTILPASMEKEKLSILEQNLLAMEAETPEKSSSSLLQMDQEYVDGSYDKQQEHIRRIQDGALSRRLLNQRAQHTGKAEAASSIPVFGSDSGAVLGTGSSFGGDNEGYAVAWKKFVDQGLAAQHSFTNAGGRRRGVAGQTTASFGMDEVITGQWYEDDTHRSLRIDHVSFGEDDYSGPIPVWQNGATGVSSADHILFYDRHTNPGGWAHFVTAEDAAVQFEISLKHYITVADPDNDFNFDFDPELYHNDSTAYTHYHCAISKLRVRNELGNGIEGDDQLVEFWVGHDIRGDFGCQTCCGR